VLSPHETNLVRNMLEFDLGYREDAVEGVRCVHLLAGEQDLVTPLFQRLLPLLPSTLSDGARLVGINARWRCFRYSQGATYRAHIDGAWPGSGVAEGPVYVEDSFGSGVTSRLTLLLYLNEGFQGGGTTFFLPREGVEGAIDAFSVEPRMGCALTFPHGDATGSLVHEGSSVSHGGVKYIIRSDVLYSRCGALKLA